MFNPNQKINHRQKCLTAAQFTAMVVNHQNHPEYDHVSPVVKFFNPFGAATWLLTELDPETGIAYGLCDLGMGFPELGYVSLDELAELGIINRDLHFSTTKTLKEWMEKAEKDGSLVGA